MRPITSRVLFVALVVVYCLTGCSVLHPRKPLPAELAGIASPPGYHDIRDWGDTFSPILQRSIQAAMKAEATNQLWESPIQYLALSGGGMDGAFGAGMLC